MHLPNCSRKLPTEKICSYYQTSQPTPSVAWLSNSRSPPDALYRGVTVNVGGLGTAEKPSEWKSNVDTVWLRRYVNGSTITVKVSTTDLIYKIDQLKPRCQVSAVFITCNMWNMCCISNAPVWLILCWWHLKCLSKESYGRGNGPVCVILCCRCLKHIRTIAAMYVSSTIVHI